MAAVSIQWHGASRLAPVTAAASPDTARLLPHPGPHVPARICEPPAPLFHDHGRFCADTWKIVRDQRGVAPAWLNTLWGEPGGGGL